MIPIYSEENVPFFAFISLIPINFQPQAVTQVVPCSEQYFDGKNTSPKSQKPNQQHTENLDRVNEAVEIKDQHKGQRNDENKKWTYEEDQFLKNLVEVQELKWNQIIGKMPGRTYQMCYSRYQRIKKQKRKNWSSAEEKMLSELVGKMGKKWKKISKFFKDRTPKQIRERYLNHLQSHISHKQWTSEEDARLLNLVGLYGHQWKKIELIFGNRSQNQLKNRFYGSLKIKLDK